MGSIEHDLNAVVATATSPDGRIEGRTESLQYRTLRFLHNSYERYYRSRDAELLAHQLGRVATLMAVAYQKARRDVMLAHGFERSSAMRPPFTSRHREYLERGATLAARGSSPGDEIQVTTTGLIAFEVSVAPGLERHDEQAFLRFADQAMNDLHADYQRVHTALRQELYRKYKGRAR
ncbi:hypothetical protein GCM10010168_74220 [Actinoplanes ianthinogenes]|uniref:Uncharacterized protein n=1 Tax=Actinoplanes ianthinogenes TaxID=122358 RepID=A0ABM7LN00_9ACTN|nr:hypothetical protein [Actinoplanes ianthinogenes]BCJ40590.1 hypothetical protein Aiant_12470 [Actinoplanes ianthinogenes]GGR44285.1 hypothetical protein GCM10010168_74220 [Actinoplanes ianthinogenes]